MSLSLNYKYLKSVITLLSTICLLSSINIVREIYRTLFDRSHFERNIYLLCYAIDKISNVYLFFPLYIRNFLEKKISLPHTIYAHLIGSNMIAC